MKTARVLLALPGLAALAWGVVLFAEYALPLRPDVFGTVGWLVGGPILNDAVIAPLTALLGLTLARVLPPPWKTPVVTGTVLTGVLAILAFPLLWRPYGTAPMPGLHDGNPTLGLTLTLAAVWLAVVLTALRHRITPRPKRPPIPAEPNRPRADPPGTRTDSPGTRTDPPDTRDAPPITRDASPITRDAPPDTREARPEAP